LRIILLSVFQHFSGMPVKRGKNLLPDPYFLIRHPEKMKQTVRASFLQKSHYPDEH
jgi:hypothetical protein